MQSLLRHRRWVVTAIAALAVLMLAGGAVSNIQPLQPPLASAATDNCGYPISNTLTYVRGADAFNEQGNIPTQTATNGPGSGIYVDSNGLVRVFASDETGLLLGANHVAAQLDADGGDDPAVTPSSPVATVPAGTHTSADVSSPSLGDRDLTDLAANGGRPFYPSMYLTDLGTGSSFTANSPQPGDWQANGGGPSQADNTNQLLNPGANGPNRATGQWAIAKVTTTAAGSYKESSSTSPTMTLPTTKNTWADIVSIAGGTAPTSTTGENYKDQFQWNSARSDLVSFTGGSEKPGALLGGHTYKVQVVLHDGDHGSDQSEACVLLTIPAPPPATIQSHPGGTDLNGNCTPQCNVSFVAANIPNTAQLAIGNAFADRAVVSADCATVAFPPGCGSVTFTLYGPSPTAVCTTPIYTSPAVALDSNGNAATPLQTDPTPANRPPTASSLGNYYFVASYSGDSAFSASADKCGDETVQVIDGRLTLSPLSVDNPIGQSHTFTGQVQTSPDDSAWTSPSSGAGGNLTMSLLNNTASAAFVSANPCALSATGSCSVTVGASQAGSVQVHGDVLFTLSGVVGTFHDVTGPGAGAGTITNDAVKHWVTPATNLLVQDQSSGLPAGASGTVTYNVYSNNTCSGSAIATYTSAHFSGSVAPESNFPDTNFPGLGFEVSPSGPSGTVTTLYFQATFTPDSGSPTSTPCTEESVSLTQP